MSPEVVPWFTMAMSLIAGGAVLLWRTAVIATSLTLRVSALERDHGETANNLRAEIKELKGAAVELRTAVWKLTTRLEVNAAEARASQHDITDTDPPPRR